MGGNTPKPARQHDDVFRMAADAFRGHVRNMRDGIGRARIFGQQGVIKVHMARGSVDRHVFEDGPEPPGGFVNFRFAFAREPDDLRIAAAFEIEHAVIAPAVFIIANQRAVGIGRQRGLPVPDKPKKMATSFSSLP